MNEPGNTPADKNYKPSGIISEEYPEKVKVAYLQGYEQAEKDLALTWEDIKTIVQILADSDWYDFEINGKLWSKEFYEEVLKRFKEARK